MDKFSSLFLQEGRLLLKKKPANVTQKKDFDMNVQNFGIVVVISEMGSLGWIYSLSIYMNFKLWEQKNRLFTKQFFQMKIA